MGAISYRGYVANVDVDIEAQSLVGRVVNARIPLDFTANAATDVLGAFHELIDDYLAECEAQGMPAAKPYSGKLLLRISPELHSVVATDAARVGWSINTWVEHAIVQALDDSRDRESDDVG